MERILLQINDIDDIRNIIHDSIHNEFEMFFRKKQENGELLSRKEAAKELRISLPKLHELTKSGAIPFHRVGSRILYDRQEIIKAILIMK